MLVYNPKPQDHVLVRSKKKNGIWYRDGWVIEVTETKVKVGYDVDMQTGKHKTKTFPLGSELHQHVVPLKAKNKLKTLRDREDALAMKRSMDLDTIQEEPEEKVDESARKHGSPTSPSLTPSSKRSRRLHGGMYSPSRSVSKSGHNRNPSQWTPEQVYIWGENHLTPKQAKFLGQLGFDGHSLMLLDGETLSGLGFLQSELMMNEIERLKDNDPVWDRQETMENLFTQAKTFRLKSALHDDEDALSDDGKGMSGIDNVWRKSMHSGNLSGVVDGLVDPNDPSSLFEFPKEMPNSVREV